MDYVYCSYSSIWLAKFPSCYAQSLFFSVTQFFFVGYCYSRHLGRNGKTIARKRESRKVKNSLVFVRFCEIESTVIRAHSSTFWSPSSVRLTTTTMLNFPRVFLSTGIHYENCYLSSRVFPRPATLFEHLHVCARARFSHLSRRRCNSNITNY